MNRAEIVRAELAQAAGVTVSVRDGAQHLGTARFLHMPSIGEYVLLDDDPEGRRPRDQEGRVRDVRHLPLATVIDVERGAR